MRNKLFHPCLFILFISIIVHYSCQKEINPGITDLSNPSAQKLTANVSGRVLDENNLPVKGAVVKAGSASSITDLNGNFNFTGIMLDKNAGFVKVEKSGYFPGSRTFLVKPNATNIVEIELIPKTASGSFDAAAGGTVNIPNGGSVQFTANSIKTTAGTAYSGAVSVSAYFINPEASNFSSIMPGDLRAITAANEERGLQSFGMMAVELTGSGGEKLNLAGGKTATLLFPIASSLLAKAPATIPLWFFDETTGLWKEEGAATKQGSNYIGTVSHFSFWNVDVPYPLVDFEAVIKQQNGTPLSYTQVLIKMSGDSAITSGSEFTDSLGKISGLIPANKNLQIEVYNQCGTAVYVQNIGPFASNTNLNTITVTNSTTAITFTGNVMDCNNAPVTNGFVDIVVAGKNYRTILTNGIYSKVVAVCSGITKAQLTAVNLAAGQQSTPSTVPLSGGNVVTNLSVCGNSTTEFINYLFRGTNYSLTKPGDSLRATINPLGTTDIEGISSPSSAFQTIYLYFPVADTGTHPLQYINISVNNRDYFLNDSAFVTITEYGKMNGYVAGSFRGMVTDSVIRYPVSGTFRIKGTR